MSFNYYLSYTYTEFVIIQIKFFYLTSIEQDCYLKSRGKDKIIKVIDTLSNSLSKNALKSNELDKNDILLILKTIKTKKFNTFLKNNNIRKEVLRRIFPINTFLIILLFYSKLIILEYNWSIANLDLDCNPNFFFKGLSICSDKSIIIDKKK